MKLTVEVSFCDKYTGETYKVGDVIEVSKERSEELLSDPRKLVRLNEPVTAPVTRKRGKKHD